jgi:hypothetical protein
MEWVDTLKGSNTQAMLKRSKPLAEKESSKVNPRKTAKMISFTLTHLTMA